MAEAVAIRGNQILRVGSDREINRLRRPQTTVIDAQGAAVLPGFNDAHVQFIEGGLSLDQIDLTGAATIDEIQGAGPHVGGGEPGSAVGARPRMERRGAPARHCRRGRCSTRW